MRSLRQLFAASTLTLILTLATFAGEMTTGIAPPQPAPTPTQDEMSATVNGNMHTGLNGDMHTTEETAADVLAGVVVDLVQGVLALL
jgi:hypothetical protein